MNLESPNFGATLQYADHPIFSNVALPTALINCLAKRTTNTLINKLEELISNILLGQLQFFTQYTPSSVLLD